MLLIKPVLVLGNLHNKPWWMKTCLELSRTRSHQLSKGLFAMLKKENLPGEPAGVSVTA